MRFSPSTQSFYPEDIEYPDLPADVITVTTAEWEAAIVRGPYDTLHIESDALVIQGVAEPPPNAKQIAKQNIQTLEISVTSRRIREAILGIDGGWLKHLEEQIANERKKL